MARITIDAFQSLLNFMGVNVLLPAKFDDISLFDIAHIDIVNVRNADKSPIFAETSRLSSMI
jgi:hypothetical protein